MNSNSSVLPVRLLSFQLQVYTTRNETNVTRWKIGEQNVRNVRAFDQNNARFAIFHPVCKRRREQPRPSWWISTKVTRCIRRESRNESEESWEKLRRVILCNWKSLESRRELNDLDRWNVATVIDFNETREKKRYVYTYLRERRETFFFFFVVQCCEIVESRH